MKHGFDRLKDEPFSKSLNSTNMIGEHSSSLP
jgi:hypothetical protein